jgi:hypothetical protein
MLQHYDTKHTWVGTQRYHVTPHGQKYPGVTTVLSATKSEISRNKLAEWAVGKDKYELEYGKAKGTWLHSKIESYLDFDRPEPSLEEISETYGVDYTDCEEEFHQWFASVEPVLNASCGETLLIESALWDDDLQVAGTMDRLGYWDGELSLCDWKTSKDWMNPNWESVQSYFCQLAAYTRMVNRIYADQISVEKAVLVIAVPDKKAQALKLGLEELIDYEAKWIRKVKRFYKGLENAS